MDDLQHTAEVPGPGRALERLPDGSHPAPGAGHRPGRPRRPAAPRPRRRPAVRRSPGPGLVAGIGGEVLAGPNWAGFTKIVTTTRPPRRGLDASATCDPRAANPSSGPTPRHRRRASRQSSDARLPRLASGPSGEHVFHGTARCGSEPPRAFRELQVDPPSRRKRQRGGRVPLQGLEVPADGAASPRAAGPVRARAAPSCSTWSRVARCNGAIAAPGREPQLLRTTRLRDRGRGDERSWTRRRRRRGRGRSSSARGTARRDPRRDLLRRHCPRHRSAVTAIQQPGSRSSAASTSGNVWRGCRARRRAPTSTAARARRVRGSRTGGDPGPRAGAAAVASAATSARRIVGCPDHDELRRGGRGGGSRTGTSGRYRRPGRGSRRGRTPPRSDGRRGRAGPQRPSHRARADHRDLHRSEYGNRALGHHSGAIGSRTIHASGPAGVGSPARRSASTRSRSTRQRSSPRTRSRRPRTWRRSSHRRSPPSEARSTDLRMRRGKLPEGGRPSPTLPTASATHASGPYASTSSTASRTVRAARHGGPRTGRNRRRCSASGAGRGRRPPPERDRPTGTRRSVTSMCPFGRDRRSRRSAGEGLRHGHPRRPRPPRPARAW